MYASEEKVYSHVVSASHAGCLAPPLGRKLVGAEVGLSRYNLS